MPLVMWRRRVRGRHVPASFSSRGRRCRRVRSRTCCWAGDATRTISARSSDWYDVYECDQSWRRAIRCVLRDWFVAFYLFRDRARAASGPGCSRYPRRFDLSVVKNPDSDEVADLRGAWDKPKTMRKEPNPSRFVYPRGRLRSSTRLRLSLIPGRTNSASLPVVYI